MAERAHIRERGFWYGCDALALGRICVADLSADRKSVRIAKGYLSFITKGAEAGPRAGMGIGPVPVRGGAGQVGAGSQHPGRFH